MSRQEQIEAQLRAGLTVQALEVIDESEQHIGHAGYQEGGESHFRVRLRAEGLTEMSRIARHRAVHEAIGKPLMAQIHALAIEIDT